LDANGKALAGHGLPPEKRTVKTDALLLSPTSHRCKLRICKGSGNRSQDFPSPGLTQSVFPRG
ncbi:MAG: hypothetical protein OXC72_12145, partial [Roseovarius sp.]|nr:hypothetical protein [Roseovarius sp.]